uniref:Uncharacterized protein n=1 Tax=Anguilla anguilla TaxID=7936 RepID=A0A0E9STS1_ANGAN
MSLLGEPCRKCNALHIYHICINIVPPFCASKSNLTS